MLVIRKRHKLLDDMRFPTGTEKDFCGVFSLKENIELYFSMESIRASLP